MIEWIGRYQIVEEIGRGAMAVVYKAYDPSIDRTLAIKVLRAERCQDEEYRMRFLREAKAAGVLSHPNIVTVYDVGEVDSSPYIVMELLEGDPLDKHMKTKGKLSPHEAVVVCLQLAKALDYAHSRGIIHRDIKPSNIIRVKGSDNVKITDFGIAHIESSEAKEHTQLGEVLGTPQYMSPEQALGKKADARSDLFSLGVILYQLVSGQKPFVGETIATLLLQITSEEAKPVEQLVPTLPRSLAVIIDRLLKKQPEHRFQSGQELAKALSLVLEGMRETEKRKTERRGISFGTKWSIIMALFVSITMVVGGYLVYQKQFSLTTTQASEYGRSMVGFMATESASSVLSEDWIAIEAFVQDAMTGQHFGYLHVIDKQGIIRGSSTAALIGTAYKKISQGEPLDGGGGVSVQRYALQNGKEIMDFDAPVKFKDVEIGRIHLGLPWEPLVQSANLTVMMLVVLLVATVLAALLVMIIFTRFVAYPMRVVRKGMEEISLGHFEHRIGQSRKDEFGELFETFDEMADSLSKFKESCALPESTTR